MVISRKGIFILFNVFSYCNLTRSSTSENSVANRIPHHFVESDNYTTELQGLIMKLLHKSDIQHCFAIITDCYHLEMWDRKFFSSQLNPTSCFIVKIQDDEDMLQPNYRTIRALKEIKRKNCDLILIFFINGIQTKRFLTFLDEYRILNTRSKFVLLYDHRILTRDVHYIWRRILSVVFIRTIESLQQEFEKSKKIGFELITVPYPNILRGTFVGKSLGVWINGNLIQKSEFFYDKATNLEGLELKTAVFEHTPMVSKLPEAINKFSGIEVEIVEAISFMMNFTVRYYQSPDVAGEKWGRKLRNGSYTGLLGEMVNRHADIAIADLHLNLLHLDLMDLSIPHSSECLTFLTPESTMDNSWKTFILPLSSDMWTGVLASLFTVGIVFYTISTIHRWIAYQEPIERRVKIFRKLWTKRNKRRTLLVNMNRNVIPRNDIFDKFSDCLLLTYSMLLQVSLPRMPYDWPLRLLTGCYWAYCIQVVCIYRASLTAILANPSPRITIDTLDELADSSLIIGAWGEQNREFFNEAFDETTQKISAKLEQVDDPEKTVPRIASGQYAYYDNEYFLRYLRVQRIENIMEIEKDGEEVLHIMKECVLNVPISIGLEKNSPLKPNVDKYLRRLIEAGLTDKWLKDSTKNLVAEEDPLPEALMDLKKFWGSLAALAIGHFFGLLALIGECLHFRYVVRRHPLYDRYNPRVYYQFVKNSL